MDASARIVVVGSANVDYIARVERLPRPGETVVGGEFIAAGGGKGANQAIAARRLGAEVTFVGRVGADASGTLVTTAFEREGIDRSWIGVDASAPTGVALIFVDRDGQNMIAVASGANHRLDPDAIRQAASAFVPGDILIVQLEIPRDAVVAALELARARGLTTVLNPAPAADLPSEILRRADWITPNEFEAATLTGVPVVDLDSARRAARILLERGAEHVVITLGERGALYASGGEVRDVPAFSVQTVDTTAAGDAFTAGLAVALGRGRLIPEALRFASAAGALAATRPGAQPSLPTRPEVQELLARENERTPEQT